MMGQPQTRIAAAMMELKEYRDSGVAVHAVLPEVAENWGLRPDLLRQTAEKSWGAPLETDRQRHAAHFQFLSNAKEIEKQSREFAKEVYEANLPGIKEYSFWQVNWEREIDELLAGVTFDHPGLEPVAREAFLDEAKHFEELIRMVRAEHA
jgi:hypothetical protein